MSGDDPSLEEVLADEDVRALSRRYFISNGFDGTLTSIGIVVGAYLTGVAQGATVFAIGIGAAVGIGTSGVWSVWEIERAEKRIELQRLEEAMLAELHGTRLQDVRAGGRKVNAVMSGTGPVLGVLIPIVPFLFEGTVFSMIEATLLGVALGVGVLFTFGAYLGHISRQRWYLAGFRMGLAGIVVALINVFLPG